MRCKERDRTNQMHRIIYIDQSAINKINGERCRKSEV
jgi:hypothetical protein